MRNEKKMPKHMPEYKIIKSKRQPFIIKNEQPTGFFVSCNIRDYNSITWGKYVFPEKLRCSYTKVDAGTGILVHGVGGVEVITTEYGEEGKIERGYVVQVTEENDYYRILAASFKREKADTIKEFNTFLDDHTLDDWNENTKQYGRELNRTPKNVIKRRGNSLIIKDDSVEGDVIGRYLFCIGDREFSTMCVIQLERDKKGINRIIEKHIDRSGFTVIERYFERNKKLQKYYLEKGKIPYSEFLKINGELFMHVFDNISQNVL